MADNDTKAGYDLKLLHSRMLDILSAIDEVCRKYNLRYYLIAGTMLGAVRHKGFIPWDDDADICMPHSDYDKLIAHCKEWLPEQNELVSAENAEDYPLPFAKIQDSHTTIIERAHLRYLGGVYIDVFPLAGVPDGKLAQRWHCFKYKLFCKLLYFTSRDPYRHGRGPGSWVPLICRKLFTVEGLQKRIRRLLKKYDFYECDKVLCFDDGFKSIVDKEVFGTPKPYIYEDRQLLGIVDYDTLLSRMYGTYMELPPIEKQRQHNFHYLDLDTPYREYKGDK